ncbi:MAG: aldo/keto reductase, partial [Acidobacteria bacterium]|nr:aldo/keto reductase [Acidobacteriota bacterium]
AAKAFKPMPADEKKQMSDELSAKNRLALDHYFRNHIDA